MFESDLTLFLVLHSYLIDMIFPLIPSRSEMNLVHGLHLIHDVDYLLLLWLECVPVY